MLRGLHTEEEEEEEEEMAVIRFGWL